MSVGSGRGPVHARRQSTLVVNYEGYVEAELVAAVPEEPTAAVPSTRTVLRYDTRVHSDVFSVYCANETS